MKIIIEHGRTKRLIRGPFNICGSRQEMQSIVDQLRGHLADESWSYGWTSVVTERQPINANTATIEWEP